MKATRILPVALASLLLSAQGICADSQAPDQAAPRRILVSIESGWLAGYADDQMAILQRSFLTALSEPDGGPSPVAYALKGFPSSTQARNKAARAAGADCWLWVKISGLKSAPTIHVQSFDLIYDTATLDFSVSRSEPFSIMDISREKWGDIVPLVVKEYPELGQKVYSRGPPPAVTLTLRALPGTVITGLSPKPLAVGLDGATTIDLPSPAPYALRATLDGYMPSRMAFYLDGQTELKVEQVASPWLYVDAAFLDGAYPGISATYAPSFFPGFVRLGFTTFRIGLAVNKDSLWSSLPLSQITALLGVFFNAEDSAARFYIGAGPLLRLSLPAGGAFTVDQLLPWGVQFVAGAQFPLPGNLRAFVELAPTVYATPDSLLFQDSFGSDNGSFPYIIFPGGAINPVELRFGLRWMI
jgi:hypothetical protein